MMGRFCRYAEKVYHLGEQLQAIRDSRTQAQIPTGSVWASALAMDVMRLGSLNAAEQQLRKPGRLDRLLGPRKPSADTIARVYEGIDPASQRRLLHWINHRLRRNKVLDGADGLRFAAIDGHEFFSQ